MTRATALAAFKIANITAEIATLRARGYRITTEIVPDDGAGAPYLPKLAENQDFVRSRWSSKLNGLELIGEFVKR